MNKAKSKDKIYMGCRCYEEGILVIVPQPVHPQPFDLESNALPIFKMKRRAEALVKLKFLVPEGDIIFFFTPESSSFTPSLLFWTWAATCSQKFTKKSPF
jgi:hypothetical protein